MVTALCAMAIIALHFGTLAMIETLNPADYQNESEAI
jgi:hypothetical protein